MANNSSSSSEIPYSSGANSEDAEVIRDLALRLLASNYLYVDSSMQTEPQLLVQQVPSEWMTDIPFPEGSRILGSFVQYQTTVLFETELVAEAVIQFYQNQLQASGWSLIELHPNSDFLLVAETQERVFCRSSTGPSLDIALKALPNGGTEVRLVLEPERKFGSICASTDYHRRSQQRILPRLVHPLNAQSLGGGASESGRGEMNMYTTIKTDTPLVNLMTHYVSQIEQAGWIGIEQGQNDLLAWSSWSLIDENQDEWRGVFFILQIINMNNNYYIHMQANCTLA